MAYIMGNVLHTPLKGKIVKLAYLKDCIVLSEKNRRVKLV